MAKKMDIEVNVDVTEELGLEASGKWKGLKFLGTMSRNAFLEITKEVGKAAVEAMTKGKEVEDDKNNLTETIIEETVEVIE